MGHVSPNCLVLAASLAMEAFLPVLPLTDGVLYPHVAMPFTISRPAARAALEAALGTPARELILTLRRGDDDVPGGLVRVGTLGCVRHIQTGDDEGLVAVVQGKERVVLRDVTTDLDGGLVASVRRVPLLPETSPATEAMRREIASLLEQAVSLTQGEHAKDIGVLISWDGEPAQLLYTVASLLSVEPLEAQELLEVPTLREGFVWLCRHLGREVQILKLRHEIADKAAGELKQEQREYFLRRQLKAIQEQLGEPMDEGSDVAQLKTRLEAADLPDPARREAWRELKRLERLPVIAPEHHVLRSYLELVAELPWRRATRAAVDLDGAQRVLDEDHHGLVEIKERVLEHLAVLSLNPGAKSPILCLCGPPGVGKTSLGQSIARALHRRFERVSLGGVHDEAELRGHRRTYVGALPGQIIKALRKAGVNDPVIMLDEIDKLGHDFHGDPAAALLEILDPEQNKSFCDNYLDVAFDLSPVLFLTTCNGLDGVPPALRDRLEVLRLPGYTHEEKQVIARRYLWPRQLLQAGLAAEQCMVGDEVLDLIIARYTREAGVRNLERALGRIVRKVARRVASGDRGAFAVSPARLHELLGAEPFFAEEARRRAPPGVAAALAWTEAGGEVLYVEAAPTPGHLELTLTGQLGEVMRESARAAETCVRARLAALELWSDLERGRGAHVHVPAGAVAKDGPSAGIAIATALASLYLGRAARPDTAMTGEVTVTGLVLPVGGLKEKLLAARRAGLRRVIVPRANGRHVEELDRDLKGELEIVLVDSIEEVWQACIPGLERPDAEAAVLPH